MSSFKSSRSLIWIALCVSLVGGLVGCSYPPEVIEAKDSLEAARKAGKEQQCPDEFRAAEAAKNEAVAACSMCDNTRAIALAKDAKSKIDALCPKPAPTPVPAPTPAPVVRAAPTVNLSASPSSVMQGQCATLTWSSNDASSVSIDSGVGRVDSSGSKQVCPDHTTQYRISATGEGGSRDASTTVTVNRVVDRLTIHVNFDFNKATVKRPEDAELQKAIAFIKKYPAAKISLVGYTDSIGRDAYNMKLSEKRAEAVKAYLVKHGIDGARIETSGRGKADPVGDNKTEKGRAANRRVEVLIISE